MFSAGVLAGGAVCIVTVFGTALAAAGCGMAGCPAAAAGLVGQAAGTSDVWFRACGTRLTLVALGPISSSAFNSFAVKASQLALSIHRSAVGTLPILWSSSHRPSTNFLANAARIASGQVSQRGPMSLEKLDRILSANANVDSNSRCL